VRQRRWDSVAIGNQQQQQQQQQQKCPVSADRLLIRPIFQSQARHLQLPKPYHLARRTAEPDKMRSCAISEKPRDVL